MLELIEELDDWHVSPSGKRRRRVRARCARCGAEQKLLKQNFNKHNRKGGDHCAVCIQDTFHHMTGTRFYRIWQGLLNRAKGNMDYENYAGRGISVCKRWHTFENFYADMYPAYSDDLTIERIDNNRSYGPKNCRWATNMEQQANKRNNRHIEYQGKKIHLAELVRRSGYGRCMLTQRLNKGMTGDEAVQSCRESTYGQGKGRFGRYARSST